jgi:hypothetical protein
MTQDTKIELYVSLVDEGTPTMHLVYAVPLGDGRYRLTTPPNYDPVNDYVLEFPPGSVVRATPMEDVFGESLLKATAMLLPDGTWQESQGGT